MDRMLLTTIDEVPGARVTRVIGLVRGNSVRGRDLGHDLLANLKNLVGGEIVECTKMIAEAREEALDRLAAQAAANGANAVVGLRFASAEVMAGAAELLAYGTAVVLEEIQARA
jgi:uncharacterized protein YbjQ (UPF0145 family)